MLGGFHKKLQQEDASLLGPIMFQLKQSSKILISEKQIFQRINKRQMGINVAFHPVLLCKCKGDVGRRITACGLGAF